MSRDDSRPPAGTPPLIGREAERARISLLVASVSRSGQRFLVVSGEPGIGKTALLGHLAGEAKRAGCATLAGAGADFERDVPFGLMIDALEDRVRDLDERFLARVCGSELSEVALVFPALAHLAAPSGTRLQEERYRVHRALRRLVEGIASAAPTALVLDDVHWADRESVEFLAHLVRHPVRAPLLVTLALRTGPAPGALTTALRAGGQDRRAEQMRLGPLGRDAVAELTGGGLDDLTLRRVYRESGGNPFYASALSRMYRRGRAPEPDRGPATGPVPATVIDAVAAELDLLPAGTKRVLQAAAVLGDGFDPPGVAQIAELPEPAVDEALDAAAIAGVIHEQGTAGLRFRHPIVRGAAYESAAPAWRRRLHARAAARRHAEGAAPGGWAHHLARSATPGDHDAIAALRQAAHAVRLTAPGTAAQWLAAALAVLGDAPTVQRLELLVPLATALAAAGELEESRRILREALPLADALPRGRVLAALTVVEHMLGSHDDATGVLEQALAGLAAGTPEAAELRLQIAWDRLYANEPQAALARAREAQLEASRLDQPALASASTAMLALTEATLGHFEPSAHAFEQGLAIVSRLPDDAFAARLDATMFLGFAAYHLDRLPAGAELVERGIAVSRATEQGQFYAPMLLLHGLIQVAYGNLAAAERLGRDAEDVARLANNTQWLTWSLTVQCATATLTGDLPRALECGQEAVTVGSYHYFSLVARSYLAAAWLEAGEPDRCAHELLAICGDPDGPPIKRPFRPVPYEVLTRAELARGHGAAAEAWARRAAFAARVVPVPTRIGEARRSQAEIALAQGDPRAAARLAQTAVEATEPAGRALETARGRLLAGTAWLAAGERAAAVDELERARTEFAACGARRLDDAAAGRLRSLGRAVARGGRPPGARREQTALSRREREIAELVCRGMTNRAIAGQLFISEKTVEGHVARVFAKLGVARRAAIGAKLSAAA